jgi:hypothetical protein
MVRPSIFYVKNTFSALFSKEDLPNNLTGAVLETAFVFLYEQRTKFRGLFSLCQLG